MKFEHSTYQKPLSMIGLGGGASSLSYAGAAGAIVTDNLSVHWDFGDTSSWDRSSTTINDLSGNSNGGTFPSGVSYVSSQGGHATKTNQNPITMTSDVFSINGANPWTLEFWHNATLYASSQGLFQDWFYHYPLSGGSAYQYNPGIGFWQSTTYGVSGEGMINPGTTGGSPGPLDNRPTSTQSLFETNHYSGSTTGWQQIVVSRESTSTNGFKVYRNGSNIYTGTSGINFDCRTVPSGYVMLIRQRNIFTTGGDMGIFRMYTGAGLTSVQVQQNYNAQKARFGIS